MLSSIKKERLGLLKNIVDYYRRNGEIMKGIELKDLRNIVKDLASLHDLLLSMGREYELARRDAKKWHDEFNHILDSRTGQRTADPLHKGI